MREEKCIQGFGGETRRKETTRKTSKWTEGYYNKFREELIAYFPL
jgi:hypothetical protein